MRRVLSKFSVFELLLIAMLAALGVAVKPVIQPLVRVITGPLAIPGGALAGGIYMMFLALAYGATRKRFSGTLTAAVQAFIVMLTGVGSHGPMSFVTYIMPGAALDLVMLALSRRGARPGAFACFFACMAANITGTALVGAALFDIPPVPMLLMLCAAALSGGLGGILAYFILKQVYRLGLPADAGEDLAEEDLNDRSP